MVNTGTFRTALKAMGKNSENMSSKIYNFSTMQNIRMQYELHEGGFMDLKNRGCCSVSHLVRKILRKEITRFREW